MNDEVTNVYLKFCRPKRGNETEEKEKNEARESGTKNDQEGARGGICGKGRK